MYTGFLLFSACCCLQAFSSCSEWGYSLAAMHALLIAVASLVVENSTGSVVVGHWLNCPEACEISPDQALNSCPLHW